MPLELNQSSATGGGARYGAVDLRAYMRWGMVSDLRLAEPNCLQG
jgi:hypothetical protein